MHTSFRSENLKGRELGKPTRRLKDNIRMSLREIGRDSVDWMHLAQDRDSGGLL
jgi:hypothetical protein